VLRLWLHEGFGPFFQLLGWHIFFVCGDPPSITGRIFHLANPVTVKLVFRLHDRVRASLKRVKTLGSGLYFCSWNE